MRHTSELLIAFLTSEGALCGSIGSDPFRATAAGQQKYQEDVMAKLVGPLSALVATACVSLSQPVLAQAVDQKLGKVHFETSCAPEAAAAFDQGMLYQHSFWYRASQREFNKALKADPG
jgi:hypothetical protein